MADPTAEPLLTGGQRIALIRHYIVTASPDGSIPLNARVLAVVDEDSARAPWLIERFNIMANLLESLGMMNLIPPELMDVYRETQESIDK